MRSSQHITPVSQTKRRVRAHLHYAALLLLIASCQTSPSATPDPSSAASTQSTESAENPQTTTISEDAKLVNISASPQPSDAPESIPPTELTMSSDEPAPKAISPTALSTLSATARQTWQNLLSSRDNCNQPYDYFPDGGIYSFYCHINHLISFKQLENILGIPIFLSGPHKNGRLNRKSAHTIGHYNPDFVQTIADWAIPATQDQNFRRATQATYERNIEPLARIYWMTYLKLQEHPHYWQAQQSELLESMANEEQIDAFFYEKFYVFMSPQFIARRAELTNYSTFDGMDDGYYNGNVVKFAVGFWIRRGIDGTAEQFADGLKHLLAAYDPDFLAETEQ